MTTDAAAADPGVLAVAGDARCLLLAVAGMPPPVRAALAQELAAAEPGDVPGLLRAWRTAAGRRAAAAQAQNGPQGHTGQPAGSAVADGANGAPRPAQGGARAVPGPCVAPASPHSAAESPQMPDTATETPNAQKPATEPPTARVAATEDHTEDHTDTEGPES